MLGEGLAEASGSAEAVGGARRKRAAPPQGVPSPRCRAVPSRRRPLAKHPERPWDTFHVKDTGDGPVVWQAQFTRFFPWDDDLPGDECWLIIARNVLDGEVKYFLSNAPEDTAAEVMLHAAFSRSGIERLFEESKGQVGLDHFEVRRYTAVMRHLILSMVSLLFLAEQVQRFGETKSGLHDLPDPRSRGSATGSPRQQTGAKSPAARRAGNSRIPADLQQARGGEPPRNAVQ